MSSNNIPLLIKHGLRDDLANTPVTNPGIIYYCYDTNELFFDFIIGTEIVRQCLNPYITDPDYGTPVFEQGKGLINQLDKDIIDTAVRFVEQNLEPQYKWWARQNIDAVGEKTVQGGEIFNRYPGNPEDPVQASANLATGLYSHAEGDLTSAEGIGSHAEGLNTSAVGNYSHAEGSTTEALGEGSHSEGKNTKASGVATHAEGQGTEASGGGHAEGYGTLASGMGAHAEGYNTEAIGGFASPSHAEGMSTKAQKGGHAEGQSTQAMGRFSHAEGYKSEAIGDESHAEGGLTKAIGIYSHTEGSYTNATGNDSHAEGYETLALGGHSHAEGGSQIVAAGTASHAEGTGELKSTTSNNIPGDTIISLDSIEDVIVNQFLVICDITQNNVYETVWVKEIDINNKFITLSLPLRNSYPTGSAIYCYGAMGINSHSEGHKTTASLDGSHAEGWMTKANGLYSHSEGDHTIADKRSAHAEGSETKALNVADHAEGIRTKASGSPSHSEGLETEALGQGSHAEGEMTKAFGEGSHVEGIHSVAIGDATHSEGTYVFAIATNSHAEGVGSLPLKAVSTKVIDVTEGETTTQKTVITVSGLGDITLSSTDLIDYLALEDETILTVEAVDSTNNEITISTVHDINPDATLYYIGSMGFASHVEGTRTLAKGQFAHAEGKETQAIGENSHAQGYQTQAIGNQSHTEGAFSVASNYQAHAEGNNTVASGENAHSEGRNTQATGAQAHAEGYGGIASGNNSHVEGSYYTPSEGQEPIINQASGSASHVEGLSNIASGQASHAEGGYTEATNTRAHAEGYYTNATGTNSHAEGYNTYAAGTSSHAEGNITIAEATGAHAEGSHYTDIKDANGNIIYNRASGYGSHVEGCNNIASGGASHSEGLQTTASGAYSHAEGRQTVATSNQAHAEGYYTEALASSSHAEGVWSAATGVGSHAEGHYEGITTAAGATKNLYTQARGKGAHAEGLGSVAASNGSHSEGAFTVAVGAGSHAEGGAKGYSSTTAVVPSNSTSIPVVFIEPYEAGQYINVAGQLLLIDSVDTTNLTLILSDITPTTAEINQGQMVFATGSYGMYSHTEGYYTTTIQTAGHAEGYKTIAGEQASHAEGLMSRTYGRGAHAEGSYIDGHVGSQAVGQGAHAEGNSSIALGDGSHAEGELTYAEGADAHAEGHESRATGTASHAEGRKLAIQYEDGSLDSRVTTASGDGSHAEGAGTTASGDYSHAENLFSIASGTASHAEGMFMDYEHFQQVGDPNKQFVVDPNNLELRPEPGENEASGQASHVEGQGNKAKGVASHAEGTLTIASGYSQHVSGQANIEDTENKYAVIVGNGSVGNYEGQNVVGRSNAYTLDWDGNAWYAGNVYVGGINSNSRINLSPYMTKVILTPSAWASNKQTATIEGISADETKQAIYINPVYGTENMDMIGNCNVYASEQVENGIVFSCDTVPTSNVEFYVKWQDVIWIEPARPSIINYSITTISNSSNSFTCEPSATWENLIGTRVGEHPGTLLEDEYGNLYVNEDASPEEIQSRFVRQYEYHLVDENNNKVHKNDIITSQNYHFEYLFFNMRGVYNISYTFDYGMTLEEWCNSEYNTGGWWADDTGITNLDYMSSAGEVNKNTILESNMIINIEPFCCFVKGTQITTSLNGDTKSIETLKEGDLVVSYNIKTKENYYTKIKKLITNPHSISMAKVYLNNGVILDMTDYHPLYTIEGFKSITDKKYPELKVGDILPTFNNKESIITNIELYKNEKSITTYTLNVINLDENIDDDTTDNYYANGIIAHNSAGCEL